MNKILIIQTAFIGDVILATPLIESIYKKYPEAKIDFLLRKGNEGLLENHPFLNKQIIWDKKDGKIKKLLNILKIIRAEKYDYVINCQRFLSSGIYTAFSNATNRVGFDKNPLSFLFTHKIKHSIEKGVHEIERNHALISFLQAMPSKMKLYPSEQNIKKTAIYKAKPYICIAPTSVWFTKQYPANKWVELINCLTNYTIYLLGGSADQKACQQIIETSSHTDIQNLSGKLSFLDTAALMKDAVMNYVNDSAPLHIASAMNATVTAIFCSTVLDFGFGPQSDFSKVVEIRQQLNCRPCGLHGRRACRLTHFNCANKIELSDLLIN